MPFKSNQAQLLKLSKLVGANSRFRNNNDRPYSQSKKHSHPSIQVPSPAILHKPESRLKGLGGLRRSVAGLFKSTGPTNFKPKESAPITPYLPLVIDISLDLAQGDPSGSSESLVDLDTGVSSADVLLELIELYIDSKEEPTLVSHDSSNLTDILGRFPHAPSTAPGTLTRSTDLARLTNSPDIDLEAALDTLDDPHQIDGHAPLEYNPGQHLRRHTPKQRLKSMLATVKVPKLRLRRPARNRTVGLGANEVASIRSTDGILDGGRQRWFTRLWHNSSTGRRLDAYITESSHTLSDEYSLDDPSTTSLDGIRDTLDTTSPPPISIGCPIPTVILTRDEDDMDAITSSSNLDIDPIYLSPFYVRTRYPGDSDYSDSDEDNSDDECDDDESDDLDDSMSTGSQESSDDLTPPITPTHLDISLPPTAQECLSSINDSYGLDYEEEAIGIAY
ncbi:hypothetical protein RhiLY_08820 [Ceratobasidium sp. AG-Ba]|nr:hypothetical protein RhiLY_08820 [Ceratobasidium sp. AG-Ba]